MLKMIEAIDRELISDRLHVGHFIYLRCCALGLDPHDAAEKYLGVQHGATLRKVHREVVERVRAVARRSGDSRWRLIGLEIPPVTVPDVRDQAPTIDEWIDAEGLDGWSEIEALDLYHERFPPAEVVDSSVSRRRARNRRLCTRRIDLLNELQTVAGNTAQPLDLVDGWLPPDVAAKLRSVGDFTLLHLQARIERGGRWWAVLGGFGPVKASRLARHLQLLLPSAPCHDVAAWSRATQAIDQARLNGSSGSNRLQAAQAGTFAKDDREAIQAWVAARASSEATRKQYTREAERFVLWCVLERQKALSDAMAEDCTAYMNFLAHVPANWISRRHAGRHASGWAPFKGPLKLASQALAITVVHSLFEWLVRARYLASNPWGLVNRRLGDDVNDAGEDGSRAFTPAAWQAMLDCVAAMPEKAALSANRLRWICAFVESTGLRASELIGARVRHLQAMPGGGHALRVHGKGRRNRLVPVPSASLRATKHYFQTRGLELDTAPPAAPLLASLLDPLAPISYSALDQTFGRLVAKASQLLSPVEARQAARASTHWLRHTHATRAAERDVPPDVVQENLGQSDPRMTARYYRAQIQRRQREMEKAFGGETASS